MAINSLQFRTNMTKELDKAIVQGATTGFFEDNVLRAKFVGAKTVLIPSMDMSGLGDYDRDNGFVQGAITLTSNSHTLQQDRARTFQLDREDNDETGIANLAGQVLSEFVRTKVVPEVDAYCLSKIAGYAASQNQTVTGTPATQAYAMFTEAVKNVQEIVGFDEELVAFVNNDFLAALNASPEVARSITVSDFKKGGVNFKVKSIDGIRLLPVPKSRMKTAYTFYDGTTVTEATGAAAAVDQTVGGFVPTGAAQDIGLIVMPKRAASLVKKSETLRTWTPEQNIKADAYKFDYRLYYDVFLKNSLLTAIYAYVY
ncbi:MAG: hypothetical protein IJU16_05305 [Clostridia bacterium]|nr:hypothetical protein [Clostridia bacterium]